MKTKKSDASQRKEAVSRVTTTIEKIRLLRSLLEYEDSVLLSRLSD